MGMPRDAEILQDVVEPRIVGAFDFAPAGQRIDHVLVKVVGNDDPQRGAERRKRRRLDKVGECNLHQRVEIGVDRQRRGRQRAGIDKHVDQEEQADQ
jgi:hypothetical protein